MPAAESGRGAGSTVGAAGTVPGAETGRGAGSTVETGETTAGAFGTCGDAGLGSSARLAVARTSPAADLAAGRVVAGIGAAATGSPAERRGVALPAISYPSGRRSIPVDWVALPLSYPRYACGRAPGRRTCESSGLRSPGARASSATWTRACGAPFLGAMVAVEGTVVVVAADGTAGWTLAAGGAGIAAGPRCLSTTGSAPVFAASGANKRSDFRIDGSRSGLGAAAAAEGVQGEEDGALDGDADLLSARETRVSDEGVSSVAGAGPVEVSGLAFSGAERGGNGVCRESWAVARVRLLKTWANPAVAGPFLPCRICAPKWADPSPAPAFSPAGWFMMPVVPRAFTWKLPSSWVFVSRFRWPSRRPARA